MQGQDFEKFGWAPIPKKAPTHRSLVEIGLLVLGKPTFERKKVSSTFRPGQ
jgi:hypothetical protein